MVSTTVHGCIPDRLEKLSHRTTPILLKHPPQKYRYMILLLEVWQ